MHNRKNAWDSRSMREEARKARNIAPFWVIGMASWAGVPLGSYIMLFHFGGTAFSSHELPWLVMYIGWLLFGGAILAGQRLPKVLGLPLIAAAGRRDFYLPPRLGVSALTFLGRPPFIKGGLSSAMWLAAPRPFLSLGAKSPHILPRFFSATLL